MVQPCPECFQTRRHKLSCDAGKRQRVAHRPSDGDSAALAYTFDVPDTSYGGVDTGCPPSTMDSGNTGSTCGGE